MDAKEKAIRQRLKDDFPHFAAKCLKILTKKGSVEPLALNEAQQYLHDRLEQQIAETGKVRALILKGRQQGASTYVEARFYHKVAHRFGVRAFILTHLDDATNNLFGMAKRYHEHCPALVKPNTKASNAKELIFDRLDSGYKVGTAGSKGTGRSSTIQYFHGSEVAYWPHAETHVAGALQAVPDEPGTEVILESTSAGPQGLFYEMCMAAQAGEGDYILVFIPWFWQSEYRKPVDSDFEPRPDEEEYAKAHGLDHEQIAWRRSKIIELGGEENFRREYPAGVGEAFAADVKGALWNREVINRNRVHVHPDLVRVVVSVDPAATNTEESDETGISVVGIAPDAKGEIHGYVLADYSLKGTPNEWGRQAVYAYHAYQADLIVGEANNGGDMVETVIKTVDQTVAYKKVHASRGKERRAGPVVAIYEQDRMHHVGYLPAVENQQCTWVPGKSKWSPDRMDALVWAATELMLGEDDGEPGIYQL